MIAFKLNGEDVSVDQATEVELWHPLHEKKAEAVLAWRRRLAEENVTQPFRQAHREVYLVTPAEKKARTKSARFEGHVLAESQAHALARLVELRIVSTAYDCYDYAIFPFLCSRRGSY